MSSHVTSPCEPTPYERVLDLQLLRFRSRPTAEEPSLLAKSLLGKGRFHEALAVSGDALAEEEEDGDLLLVHGLAWLELNELGWAQMALTRAARVEPEWGEPWRWLAELLQRRGDIPRALAAIEHGLQRLPNDDELLAQQRQLRSRLDAVEFLRQPDSHEPSLLVEQLLHEGFSETAMKVLDVALRAEEDDCDLLLQKVRLLRREGAEGQAKLALGRLLTVDPSWHVPWDELISMLIDADDEDEARATLERALRVADPLGSLEGWAKVLAVSLPEPLPKTVVPAPKKQASEEVEIEIDIEVTPIDVVEPSLTKPSEARPVEARPVEARPVEALPIEALPIEALPVEALPIEALRSEASPIEVAPVESTDASAVEAVPAVEVPSVDVVTVESPVEPTKEAFEAEAGHAPAASVFDHRETERLEVAGGPEEKTSTLEIVAVASDRSRRRRRDRKRRRGRRKAAKRAAESKTSTEVHVISSPDGEASARDADAPVADRALDELLDELSKESQGELDLASFALQSWAVDETTYSDTVPGYPVLLTDVRGLRGKRPYQPPAPTDLFPKAHAES
ncbi:MAG: hypothetical protein AAGF12_23135 [Myxococcota bacterium]